MTPYLKLQDHNVVWEHTLNVVVRMDVDRDTGDLLPNELKLVVMQVCRLLYLALTFRSHVHYYSTLITIVISSVSYRAI